MTRAQPRQLSTPNTSEGARMPQAELEFTELLREQIRSCPDQSLLELVKDIAEVMDRPFSVRETFHALDGDTDAQGRLYDELMQTERWGDVEALVQGHQIKPLLENGDTLRQLFATTSPEVGQILANELIIQSFPTQGNTHKLNRGALDAALKITPPEYLIGLSEEGLHTLRERFGLNHVVRDRFISLDPVLDRAKNELTKMTDSPELGQQLVDQMLTYPRSLFKKECKTRHELPLKPFDPEKLTTDVAGVLELLGRWSKLHLADPLPDRTRDDMLQTLSRETPYEKLPEPFKETIRRELTHGPLRLARALTSQRDAEIVGYHAEVRAGQLLSGMRSIVNDVSFSLKYSDSDMMGIDVVVGLLDGRTVCLDIKASEGAKEIAAGKRREFANHTGLSPSYSFVKNPAKEEGPGKVYRNSTLVVVNPRDPDDQNNIERLRAALTQNS